MVDKDNKINFRPVTVGDWQGNNWFITEGLLSGEQVVVDGSALHPGDTVKIKQTSQESVK